MQSHKQQDIQHRQSQCQDTMIQINQEENKSVQKQANDNVPQDRQIQFYYMNCQVTSAQERTISKDHLSLSQIKQKEGQINREIKQPILQAKPNPNQMQVKEQPKNITERITSMKNSIMAKILAHNQNINSQLAPTAVQIQKCTKMLQSEFPSHRLDLIIKSLHTLFHQNCKQQSEIDDQSFHSGSGETNYTNYTNPDYMKANILVRQREAVRMPFQTRLTQEQRIAISYLNYGYGVKILREYVRDPTINPTRYNNLITTIMKMAFRKLQDFMKNLGHSVVPLNSQDEKVIRAPLTNCQKWLPPDELETLYKFIKLACSLQNKVDISTPTAVKLYSSCIRQLRQRQLNQQDYRNQKVMMGGRRLPRITQNMYSNLTKSKSGKNPYQNSHKVNTYQTMPRTNGIIGQNLYGPNPNYNLHQTNPRYQPFGQQYTFNSPQISNGSWRTHHRVPYS